MVAWIAQNEPLDAPADGESGSAVIDALPMYLLVAGVALLVIVLMGNIKKKARRGSVEEDLEPRERIQSIREQAQTTSALQNRTAEAAEITRELTALIDNRSERLEILIQQADERIARLERLSQEAEERLTPRHAEMREQVRSPAGGSGSSTLASEALKQQIYDLADQGHASGEIAQRLNQHAGKVELILALRRA